MDDRHHAAATNRNPGTALELAWFEGVGVNLSAAERRAAPGRACRRPRAS